MYVVVTSGIRVTHYAIVYTKSIRRDYRCTPIRIHVLYSAPDPLSDANLEI